MKISQNDWVKYRDMMSGISAKAAAEFENHFNGRIASTDRKELMDYAMALVDKYSEASAALACQMYERIAELSGVTIQPAIPAESASYGEVAKGINGTLKQSPEGKKTSDVIARLVKRAGADTMLQNADRDGAQFAWVPSGDTCAFCITLASRGWQYMSKKALRNGHAEHIHANCDCQYCVRFDSRTTVEGYDPDKYLEMYNNAAPGEKPGEKIKTMRRRLYAANSENSHSKTGVQLLSSKVTNLLDEKVGNSVGAKFENYDILDLTTGERYHLAENSTLQRKKVFAGKGAKSEYRDAWKYVDKYPWTKEEDWQHVKAFGVVSTPDGDFKAEIHYSQHEEIGKVDLFVKRWLE